jgi:hypothetical protein
VPEHPTYKFAVLLLLKDFSDLMKGVWLEDNEKWSC